MVNLNKTIFALLLAATGLCGCSQNEDLDASNEGEATQGVTGVVFRLQTNTSSGSTRGATAEDTDNRSQGTPAEYQVNNARVYLYDNPTKLFVKSILLTNLTKVAGSDASGMIVYETERVSVPQGTYDIFVVANSDKDLTKDKEDDFLANIDSMTYAKGLITDISKGVVMANRASDNVGVVLKNATEKAVDDNVVSIVLERVLARLDIAKGSDKYTLTDKSNVTSYATVTLDRHYIVNLSKYYYSFRHTAVLKTFEEPAWSLSQNFGGVNDVNGYVIDPYFFKKTINATNFDNQDKYYQNFLGDAKNPNSIQWTNFKPATPSTDVNYYDPAYFNTAYCLENCMLQPAQKNAYSTGVIFDARFEPNGVYHLNAGGTLEFITNKSNYPEVLYYYDYKFYDSTDALAAALGVSSVTSGNMDLYQAKKFQKADDGYHCYYVYWIRHLDNYKNTEMGVMEFGVVRNNLYRMIIAQVSGLGDSEIIVVPDKPDEGETNLKVILNVKPWIVRDLTDIVL